MVPFEELCTQNAHLSDIRELTLSIHLSLQGEKFVAPSSGILCAGSCKGIVFTKTWRKKKKHLQIYIQLLTLQCMLFLSAGLHLIQCGFWNLFKQWIVKTCLQQLSNHHDKTDQFFLFRTIVWVLETTKDSCNRGTL